LWRRRWCQVKKPALQLSGLVTRCAVVILR
jgi:hypothetical protein